MNVVLSFSTLHNLIFCLESSRLNVVLNSSTLHNLIFCLESSGLNVVLSSSTLHNLIFCLESSRLNVVLSSSTLHNLWKNPSFKPDQHIDFDTIIGKFIFLGSTPFLVGKEGAGGNFMLLKKDGLKEKKLLYEKTIIPLIRTFDFLIPSQKECLLIDINLLSSYETPYIFDYFVSI